MSKIIDSLVQASINSKQFAGVILVKLDFDGDGAGTFYRYNNSPQSVFWDEEGLGEVEYAGVGGLGSISVLPESKELQAQTIQLGLSGIPANSITEAFDDKYIGKPVYIWVATLDPDTYAVEGGQDGPVLVFAGRMDNADIVFGETCDIIISATNRLADWERPRGGRFNQGYQKRKIDPNDTGFEYVQAIQDKTISWGAYTIQDDAINTPDNDSDFRPECFEAGTLFKLADGSLKPVEELAVGDMMLEGGLVYAVHTALGLYEDCYDYNGVVVSGKHFVLENGKWLAVEDSEKGKYLETSPKTLYSVTNANNTMIAANGTVFSDYSMVPGNIYVTNSYRYNSLTYLNSNKERIKELEQLTSQL